MIELKNVRPGEKVIKVIKVHWIAYVILGLHVLITLIISAIFHLFLGFTALSFFFTCLLWMISLVLLYIEWLNYELDMFIITNSRIVGIEQISFLNRTVSECNLAQVQEVNSQTKGFFPNIFNYGKVAIQTAGNITSLTMNMCPDAMQQARTILNIVETYKDVKSNHISEDELKKRRDEYLKNK